MHSRSILFCVLFITIVALASGFYLHWLAKRRTCSLCPASAPCCSKWGFCGSTSEHCGTGCQSGPCLDDHHDEKSDRPSLITKSIFRCAFPTLNDTLLAHRFTGLRQSRWLPVNLDEAAVFLSHVSHETDGLKTYTEYCQRTESCHNYQESWCSIQGKPEKEYYGRGWFQLSYPCNYWNAGQALGLDLLADPDLVAQSDRIAAATAIWFYKSTQMNEPAMRGDFAASTRILNRYECLGNIGAHLQTQRVNIYQRIRQCFHLPLATEHLYC